MISWPTKECCQTRGSNPSGHASYQATEPDLRNFWIQFKQCIPCYPDQTPHPGTLIRHHIPQHLIWIFTVCHGSSYCFIISWSMYTVKLLNFQSPKNLKIWTMWLYHRVISPKDADRIANSVDPDQTAPLGAVWSGSALFAQAYLSENLGWLR